MAVPIAFSSAAFSFAVVVAVVATAVEAVGGDSTPGRVACSSPPRRTTAVPAAAPAAVAAGEARVPSPAASRVDNSASASLASLLSTLTSVFGRVLRPERCHWLDVQGK